MGAAVEEEAVGVVVEAVVVEAAKDLRPRLRRRRHYMQRPARSQAGPLIRWQRFANLTQYSFPTSTLRDELEL